MEWMDELQTGDKIIAIARSTKYLRTVECVTDEFIITTNGDKFKKSNGFLVGIYANPNNNLHLIKSNKKQIQQLEQELKRKDLLSTISKTKMRLLSVEKLEEIVNIINK